MEDLKAYFAEKKGMGVLSTSGADGTVNAAVFSRPHCMPDGTLAFIMPERKTHRNLLENPRAHYLFREDGPGYRGKRISLRKMKEEKDSDLLYELRKREGGPDKGKPLHLVFFFVEAVLPLIGAL
ncbi:MAG: pyridoxamine 5'-phosphate oxidase family protein [Thermodesulfobacteriota bacterium]